MQTITRGGLRERSQPFEWRYDDDRVSETKRIGGRNMADSEVFAFSYGIMRPLLSMMGLGPAMTHVTFREHLLEIRFSYAFRVDVPYSAIYNARPEPGMVSGIGVHGWRGSWLVNGSFKGLVGFDVDQKLNTRLLGFPVTTLHIRMSLAEPQRFLDRLRGEVRLGTSA